MWAHRACGTAAISPFLKPGKSLRPHLVSPRSACCCILALLTGRLRSLSMVSAWGSTEAGMSDFHSQFSTCMRQNSRGMFLLLSLPYQVPRSEQGIDFPGDKKRKLHAYLPCILPLFGSPTQLSVALSNRYLRMGFHPSIWCQLVNVLGCAMYVGMTSSPLTSRMHWSMGSRACMSWQ